MKVRSGFISNSSSSSFIVGFEKKPASVKELQEMLFDKEIEVTNEWLGTFPTKVIAETIFREFENSIVNEQERDEELENHYNLFPYSTSFFNGQFKYKFSREQLEEVFGDAF